MKKAEYRRGMTLVEVMMAIIIIAALAALIVPVGNLALRNRHNAHAASRLRQLVAAFELYYSETGRYPADVYRAIIPPEMTDYFTSLNIDWFAETTALGGNWDWGYETMGALATIAIASPTVAASQMIELDRLIDDGNLNTGKFLYNGNQHYYYIIKK